MQTIAVRAHDEDGRRELPVVERVARVARRMRVDRTHPEVHVVKVRQLSCVA